MTVDSAQNKREKETKKNKLTNYVRGKRSYRNRLSDTSGNAYSKRTKLNFTNTYAYKEDKMYHCGKLITIHKVSLPRTKLAKDM